MRRRNIKIAAAAAAAVLGLTGTYGYFSDTMKVTNVISLGDVNIGLKEYEKKGTVRTVYKGARRVLPGETVSKIPEITNYAKPCWVRARIFYQNDRKDTEGFGDGMLLGIPENWIRRGEYYYYTKVLKRNEKIHLFENLRIPETWTEEHQGQKLEVMVQAEAIQADNFLPDFSGMSPWGNQKIQVCVHKKEGAPSCQREKTRLTVEFNGKAHKLMAVPGDFFSNFGRAMPGDALQDTIQISNTTDQKAEILFRTQVEKKDSEGLELLQGIGLCISMEGKVLYQGTLDSPELQKLHSLGNYEPGSSGKMEFTLSIPEKWDNAYALREAEVQWIFEVKEEEKQNPEDRLSEKLQETAGKHHISSKKSAVKTGDSANAEQQLLVGTLSGMLAITLLFRRKGGGQK